MLDILVHVTSPATVIGPLMAPPVFSNLSVARVWSPVVLPATVVVKVERLFVSVAIELVLELIALVLVLRELVRLATSAVFAEAALVFAVTDVVRLAMSEVCVPVVVVSVARGDCVVARENSNSGHVLARNEA